MKYDILFEGGHVVDGSGNIWFKADVGVVGDKIVAVGDLKGASAARRVNAKGHMVAPGFMDIHSHSDIPLLVDPRVESKVYQGITVEVVGNCGTSAAPMNKAVKAYREKYAGGSVPDDFKLDWSSMKDYLDRVDGQGVSFNVATWVGHGTIRQNVMGHDNREPTDAELRKMKRLVDDAMGDGAYGMSTGLIYPPSVYAKTPEIIELAKVVAKHGGLYASHIRGEEKESLLDAVREAIEIGEKADLPVQIAHFKASGKKAWGMTKQSLALVEEARAHGIDVTYDQYPYVASSTGLAALIPHWGHEGGPEKMMERLRDPEQRKRMAREQRMERDWDGVLVVFAKNNPQYNGKTIAEIAKEQGKKPHDAVCDLLLAENTVVQSVMFGMNEEDVKYVLKSPIGMVGSDGSAISPKGILGKGKPHPRYYGTFPRVLGKYAREEKVISMEEAVRKMTSAPAMRLGLKDRGLLREGYKADVVVFDPLTVKDEATFADPHRFPTGIPYVVCNGVFTINKGKHTGALPGRTLRKGK
ncbi:MAG: D-aminoacylase [Candidatus Bathyarchaeota archaeon]|nr:D-aminoacylase [Candidatus Bathyarchaeota archaeon]